MMQFGGTKLILSHENRDQELYIINTEIFPHLKVVSAENILEATCSCLYLYLLLCS